MDEKYIGTKKVAVLIDAENISLKYLDKIFTRARSEGNVCFKRIYGKVKIRDDKNNPLLEFGITHIQCYSYVPEKNTADMVLAVDAMDQLYKNGVDVFCIVSSDSDFAPLVNKIIEEGRTVIGMGESKTVKSFRNSCNEFILLDGQPASKKQTQKPKAAPPKVEETVADEENAPLPETSQDGEADTDVKMEATAEAGVESETATEAEAEQSDATADNSEGETAELPELEKVKEIAFDIIKSEMPEDGRLLLTTLITELQEQIAGFSVKKYKKGNATRFAEAIGLTIERSGKNSVFVRLPTPTETPESDKGEVETVTITNERTETAGDTAVTENKATDFPPIEQVKKDIEAILITNGDVDGWVRFKFVSDELNKRYVFSTSNYNCATMGELLEKMGFEITTKIKSKKKTYYVRIPHKDTEGAETENASDTAIPAYEETIDTADDVTLTVETEAAPDSDQPEPDKAEQEDAAEEEEEEEPYVLPTVDELPEELGTADQLRDAFIFVYTHESVSSPTRLTAAMKRYYPDFKIKDFGYTKMKNLLEDLGLFFF